MVWEISPEGEHQNPTSPANFLAWREQSTTFDAMAAFSDQRLNLTGTGEPEEVAVQLTTPQLFTVLGVNPIFGRTFTEEDGRPTSPEPNPTEIIGVVQDVKDDSLTGEAEPTVYFSHGELTYPFMTLVIRTVGDPAAIAPAVQRELRVIDPDQPVSDVRTMDQCWATISRALASTRCCLDSSRDWQRC
jgi:hypothetical protein